MRKSLYSALVLFAVLSCTSGHKSVLNITATGLADSTMVLIDRLNVNQLLPVDTVFVVKGKSVCELDCTPSSPDFFYVTVPGKGGVSLLVASGDRLDVNLDDYTVAGSAEAELFNSIETDFSEFSRDFAAKSAKIAGMSDAQLRKDASDELVKSFVDFKKKSIRQIMTAPASMTNIPVLFRKVTPELPVFGEENDVYLMQNVYDTLSVLFPQSPYVAALKNEIDSRKDSRELAAMISSAQTVSFPDIELPDISGQQRKLSDLAGKVTLLLFWSSGMENSSVMNAELKNLYTRYHDAGLEIYQVSLDVNKTSWAGAVRSQNIEWISVIDTRGTQSVYVPLYYVAELPSAYIIARDGTISARYQVDMDKLDRLISSAVNR